MLSSLSSVSSQSLNILARGVATTCGILVNEFGPPEVMKMATAMELPTLQLNQVLSLSFDRHRDRTNPCLCSLIRLLYSSA